MFAALDLGTNNCRLSIAKVENKKFEIIETFSRTVRLGEGIWEDGYISDAAQERTIAALQECATRLKAHNVTKKRLIATEACRIAKNKDQFLKSVKKKTGLTLKVISAQEEATLAMMACLPFLDRSYDRSLIIDIGGGSTEIAWLNFKSGIYKKGGFWLPDIVHWSSLSKGVVSLAEKFTPYYSGNLEDIYQEHVEAIYQEIKIFFSDVKRLDNKKWKSFYLLGTSGTVTTLAALYLGLKKYNRYAVDGLWLDDKIILPLIKNVVSQTSTLDIAQNYVGEQRADLLIPGCAILEAFVRFFPQIKIRVADKGIREGIIQSLLINNFNKNPDIHKK